MRANEQEGVAMTTFTTVRGGVFLTLILALTACGNAQQDEANLLKSLPKAIFSRKAPPPVVTPEQLGQALASTSAAITLYVSEQTKGQFLLQDIERNGPYQSFGSASRRVIVMRDGMITSTRGLGGDLMSSEEDDLLALVKRAAPGTARYVQRFLTPEDVNVTYEYACSLDIGGSIPVVAGALKTSARMVTATCIGAHGEFTNTYAVNGGQILSSRQWLGDTLGYMQTQAIRL